MSALPVVVVGAGISGLVTAASLARAGRAVVVLESSSRPGGIIRTVRHDGFLYDVGPDSFLETKADGVGLCRELGLSDELVKPLPSARQVLVAHEGTLFPMPPGLSLGVPTRLGPLLDSPLLSDLGKARALLEPFVPRHVGSGEQSIAAFFERRLGREMAERLAAPLLAGVYAGDAERLSMDAAFPELVALEKRHGSLFVGMSGQSGFWSALSRPKPLGASPFISLTTGMGRLIERLVAELPAGALRLDTAVQSVQPTPTGVRVRTGAGTLEASHVVLAGAPSLGGHVLEESLPTLASLLAEVRGAPTVTVFFGLDADGPARSLDASGFIVPPGEGDILAATWVSSKWADRAPTGGALVRAFLGGARRVGPAIESATDDELVRVAYAELTRLMGSLGPVRFSRVYRYPSGSPQPELGHLSRLAHVQRELEGQAWLSLTGPGFSGGVGIPDCIRGARATASRILAASAAGAAGPSSVSA